ncbi:hypothetical protein DFH27DRAFT_529936 [Peziza echinospora]|nr:hypothetical protein DFH27DRAFT_529936 [Peziza echinospora]
MQEDEDFDKEEPKFCAEEATMAVTLDQMGLSINNIQYGCTTDRERRKLIQAYALKMFNEKALVQWGEDENKLKLADAGEGEGIEFNISRYLDYTSSVGYAYKPLITRSSMAIFNNVEIVLGYWGRGYRSKHAFNLDFTLEGKTICLRLTNDRILSFIVLHPIANPDITGSSDGAGEYGGHTKKQKGMERSAIPHERAKEILKVLREAFNCAELMGCGFDEHASSKINLKV